jgi:drug/metabolite transporter (DMT)-like permease
VLILAGRMFPLVGDAVALVLGVELLVLGRLRRDEGPLVAGALLTGVGSAILLAAGPLQGRDADTIGGAFVLAVGCGFGLVALLTKMWLHRTHHWSWITALGAGVLGVGLLAGPDNLTNLLSWVVPAGLLIAGAALTVAWWRRRNQ